MQSGCSAPRLSRPISLNGRQIPWFPGLRWHGMCIVSVAPSAVGVAWIRRQPNRCARALIVSLAASKRVGSGTEYRLTSESTRVPAPDVCGSTDAADEEGKPVTGEFAPCSAMSRLAWASETGT